MTRSFHPCVMQYRAGSRPLRICLGGRRAYGLRRLQYDGMRWQMCRVDEGFNLCGFTGGQS